MWLRNRIIISIVIFFAVNATATNFFEIKEKDSFLEYHILGIYETNKNLKVLFKIKLINSNDLYILRNLKQSIVLNQKTLKVFNDENKFFEANDVIVEDYVENVKLIYYINNIDNKKINKIEFINKEFKLEL